MRRGAWKVRSTFAPIVMIGAIVSPGAMVGAIDAVVSMLVTPERRFLTGIKN